MRRILEKCVMILGVVNTIRADDIDNREQTENVAKSIAQNLENTFSEYLGRLVQNLEQFNDRHLGGSVLGELMHYEEIKPKAAEVARQGRSVKKMSMAMMPLVFHVGATSTWLLLTALMTAKSVAIGLALLVFKIAVSAAKVSSFFTTLKNKQNEYHHHHGHDRSMTHDETAHIVEWPASPHDAEGVGGGWTGGGWAGAAPEVSPYRTIPDSYTAKEPHGGFEYQEADD